ncbi:MAG: glycosyltransferase family 39 protein, partial [Microcystis sp. M49629_WE12]|nr:glycosyltransferase family 39 protein [Microcystis sp. M49629_WE12]
MNLSTVISDLQQRSKERLSWSDFCWLGLVIILGLVIRLTQLTSKPPWTDEFATMVFSIGNNYQIVPLNQIISLTTLFAPLQSNDRATIGDVIKLVIQEDNHPPLYFILAYLWNKLFFDRGEYVSLEGMRSLAVFWGVISIPLIYFISKLVFKSGSIAFIAAILMAVSPYGVFISQEARHYTLAVVFVLISLGCFLRASVQIIHRQRISPTLVFFWLIVNCLGLL